LRSALRAVKREFPANQQAMCSRNHAICLTACE
jgi:hypothetical protein